MANTITYQEEMRKAKEAQKKNMITFVLIMFVVLLVPAFSMFNNAGTNAFLWSDEGLSITYPDDTVVEVRYDQINAISFSEGIPFGTCVSGGTEDQYRFGTWNNEEFGDYQLFTHLDFHNCIILDTDAGILVFNYESDKTTAALYESVQQMLVDKGYLEENP